MNRRILLIILVVLILVAAGVGAFFFINSQNGNAGAEATATPALVGLDSTEAPPENTPTPVATPIPTIELIVAIQNINRGQTITPDLIDFREWPALYAPISAITNPEDVIGKIARVDVFREQPILVSMITENLSELGAVGSDAGALLPQGRRLVAVPVDRITSVGYALQPGDRVDVIVSLLYVDVDPEFQTLSPNFIRVLVITQEGELTVLSPAIEGRPESIPFGPLGALASIIQPVEQQRPRLVSQMTIQDALVVQVGNFPEDGSIFGNPTPAPITVAEAQDLGEEGEATAVPASADDTATTGTQTTTGTGTTGQTAAAAPEPARPDIVALAVSPQEAVTLTYYIEARFPITFALRPANEIGTVNTEQVNLEYIMNTYRITLPRQLPYSVEPAIRSIRELSAGDVIELREPTAVPAQTEGENANANNNNGGGG